MEAGKEEILRGICGKENPFLVPTGYFDALPDCIMSRIHSRERKKWNIRYFAIAAMLAGCVFMGTYLFHETHLTETTAEDEAYLEEYLDYSMIGNMEIASYLTEAE